MSVIRGKLAALARQKLKLSRSREAFLITIIASAAITAVLSHFEFNAVEAALYDLRVRHGWQARPSSDIVLVTIDDSTLSQYEELSPLSLRSHARFFESLKSYRPRAVGYLANLNRASSLESESSRIEASQRILDSHRELQQRSIPVVIGTPFDVTGEVVPPYPLSMLPHGLALIHKDGNVFAGDKVTRRALTSLYDRPAFHLALAREAGLVSDEVPPRGSYDLEEVEASYFHFRYHGNPIASKQRSTYTRVPFQDIVEKRVDAATLDGKILLIGTAIREDSTDFAFTPYSSEPLTTTKLAIHASILDSVIGNDGLLRPSEWIRTLSTFVVTATVIGWVMNSTPLTGVLASFGMVGFVWLASMLLFNGIAGHHGIWLETAHPSLGILVSYYLSVPYRLIREYRKRWEYQRKHQLLVEVEELKTNFLSLVTHDLKTPVARIQGLAEVLMMKASMRLTDRDQESLKHIISSTDELNRFISSILELARIETSKLMPRLESRDINQLIEKCAETFKAPARARGVRLELDLEPLFPIRFDPSLIQKVLHNLVDNAIKYSAPGGLVRLETREQGNWVEVRVHDQGIGMTDSEVENVFKKFFRAKNETTAKVGGSGLGLYLTKYFVEAHSGEVRVESEFGRGSTFTIRLRSDLVEVSAAGLPRKGQAPGLSISSQKNIVHSQGESS